MKYDKQEKKVFQRRNRKLFSILSVSSTCFFDSRSISLTQNVLMCEKIHGLKSQNMLLNKDYPFRCIYLRVGVPQKGETQVSQSAYDK